MSAQLADACAFRNGKPVAVEVRERWTRLRTQLANRRIALHLSQETVAMKLGTPGNRTGVGQIERGQRMPSTETLLAHAVVLKMDLALVTPAMAPLLNLSPSELTALVQAASVAMTSGQIRSPERRHLVASVLMKLRGEQVREVA